LLKACKEGDFEEAEQVLKEGAEVNVKDDLSNAPLHYTALGGYARIAALLLEKNANVMVQNNKGNTPLIFVNLRGYREIIDLLKRHGATK